MKKVLLTVAAIFAFGFASAQDTTTEGGFANGDVFITGAVGFGSSKTGDAKTNSFEIAPSVGFFVTPNIALGGRLGYESSKDKTTPIEKKTNEFSIGVFGRYYMTPASKFSIFGELGVNYSTSKTEIDTPGSKDAKTNGFGVEVAPGISYFLAKNFALEARWGVLGYSSAKPDEDGAEATNDFDLNLDLRDITLGLIYKF
ncbi:MAG TPA: porin family protein [Flavobacterium sp.]|nr:porin family protein [Flavobacterium sp.]